MSRKTVEAREGDATEQIQTAFSATAKHAAWTAVRQFVVDRCGTKNCRGRLAGGFAKKSGVEAEDASFFARRKIIY